MNPSADIPILIGRVLIAAWTIYGIFKYGQKLDPVARRLRWTIVIVGFLASVVVLKFFPRASFYLTVWLIIVPTILFLVLPDLSVQLVRAFLAIKRRVN
jgi:hypothetical protein